MKKIIVGLTLLSSISVFAGEIECNQAIKDLEDKAVNLYVSNALKDREGTNLTYDTYNTVEKRKEEIKQNRANVKKHCDL